MTVSEFSRWLFGFINSIMSIKLPFLNYNISLWEIFTFFGLIYLLWSLIHHLLNSGESESA